MFQFLIHDVMKLTSCNSDQRQQTSGDGALFYMLITTSIHPELRQKSANINFDKAVLIYHTGEKVLLTLMALMITLGQFLAGPE